MTVRSFFLSVGGVLLLLLSVGKAQDASTLSAPATPELDVSTNEGGGMDLLSKLPVHLTLGLDGGYDNNVLNSGGDHSSFFARGSALLAYDLHGLVTGPFGAPHGAGRSGGRRGAASGNHAAAALHGSLGAGEQPQLDIDAGGDLTYYTGLRRGKTSDLNIFLDSSGSFNLAQLLTIGGNVYVAYRTEPDFSSNVGVENQRTNYLSTSDNLSVSYHWSPRVDFVTGDDIQIVQYDKSSLKSQNRFLNTSSEEVRFNFRPDMTLIGDYRYQIVDYDDSARDSTTHYGLVGVEKSLGPQLKMDVRGGFTFRSYTQDGDSIDPHIESSVIYEGAHHAVIDWNSSYGIEESNLSLAATRKTFRTGVNLHYGFSSRISGSIDGYYHHDEEQFFSPSTTGTGGSGAGSFSEDAYDVSGSLRYAVKAYLTINLTYQHTELTSSAQSGRDYSRNRVSAGIKFIY
jgi:hypothetical protein